MKYGTTDQPVRCRYLFGLKHRCDVSTGELGFGVIGGTLLYADEAEIVFNGARTRWPEELSKVSHPANGLYNAVRESVKGASCGCAAVFGATKSIEGAECRC